MSDRKKLAVRNDEPVICARCGKSTERQMRGQKYCSRICRERARKRSRKAFLGRTARPPATPKKNRKDFNALAAAIRRSSLGICGPAKVIEAECFAARAWKPVISPDGVPVQVTRRRKEPGNRRRNRIIDQRSAREAPALTGSRKYRQSLKTADRHCPGRASRGARCRAVGRRAASRGE